MCIRLQVTWVVRLYADIMDINPMESAVGFRSMSTYWTAGLAVKKIVRAFVVRFRKPKARACPRAAGKRTQRLFSLLKIWRVKYTIFTKRARQSLFTLPSTIDQRKCIPIHF